MNIAEILKYCPKGTKLYSTVHGEVTLHKVYDECTLPYPIYIDIINSMRHESLTKEGQLYEDKGECILFPSKNQKNWNKFRIPVNKGDIMMHIDGSCPFIASGETITSYPKAICGISGVFIMSDNNIWTSEFYIPASIKAVRELFNKMEKAGYRWNSETLELEKIKKIEKESFKPFDKVLVRNDKVEKWRASLFSNINTSCYSYTCINARYRYCIPYEGNEHLIGTNKDR